MARRKRKKPGIFSRIIKFFIVILACVILLIPALLGVVMYLNAPVQSDKRLLITEYPDGITRAEDDSYYIEVRRGESAQSVGRRLEIAGIISNRHFWYILCRLGNEYLKTGMYRIEMPSSQIAIQRLLVSGRQILHRVTIPEGVTLKKTARILEDAGICSAEDFIEAAADPAIVGHYRIPNTTMEGYLFPDTYLFPGEYPAARVVRHMADTFFTRLGHINPAAIYMTPEELNRYVILASIVEREYRLSDEAPVMAGVFNNRLQIGMALQSCATVEYIITEILDRPHPTVLFNRDLEIRSPYNTYLVPGLPPGPISAPGIVALQSSFFPAETQFFYFRLTDPQTGRHYFSRTFDEHIRAGQLVPKGRL